MRQWPVPGCARAKDIEPACVFFRDPQGDSDEEAVDPEPESDQLSVVATWMDYHLNAAVALLSNGEKQEASDYRLGPQGFVQAVWEVGGVVTTKDLEIPNCQLSPGGRLAAPGPPVPAARPCKRPAAAGRQQKKPQSKKVKKAKPAEEEVGELEKGEEDEEEEGQEGEGGDAEDGLAPEVSEGPVDLAVFWGGAEHRVQTARRQSEGLTVIWLTLPGGKPKQYLQISDKPLP